MDDAILLIGAVALVAFAIPKSVQAADNAAGAVVDSIFNPGADPSTTGIVWGGLIGGGAGALLGGGVPGAIVGGGLGAGTGWLIGEGIEEIYSWGDPNHFWY